MTIDEAIHDTEVMKKYLEYRDEPRSDGLGVLIDIAYKYQKIKEIVENNNGWTDSTLEHSRAFAKIVEVIEDGNDG